MGEKTANVEEWRVEKLVPGGAGFARRSDGTSGFVSGAFPGELVRVTRLERKKGYAVARAFDVVQRSVERVEPLCPIAKQCGGCDWIHLDYQAQLAHKSALIAEALRRTGGFRQLPPISVLPSPRTSHYRVRIRLHVDEQGRVGFFAAESHQLIPVESCAIARPELNGALAELRVVAGKLPRELACLREIELRSAPASRVIEALLVPRSGSPAAGIPALLLRELERCFRVTVLGAAASPAQRYPLAGDLELEVPPGAFVQVNWEINLAIIERIVDGARQRHARTFLDVYAGAGNFTLPLAALGLQGVSVEAHPLASAGCAGAVHRHGFERVQVVQDDVRRALAGLADAGSRFDLVVLDPPRSGAREVLPLLAALRPPHVAYLSCDPVTLARDLKELTGRGYQLVSVEGFDMFPSTHHVETLVWLEAPC